MTGALVAGIDSSKYAGISFGQAHRGTPTLIMTADYIGERSCTQQMRWPHSLCRHLAPPLQSPQRFRCRRSRPAQLPSAAA